MGISELMVVNHFLVTREQFSLSSLMRMIKVEKMEKLLTGTCNLRKINLNGHLLTVSTYGDDQIVFPYVENGSRGPKTCSNLEQTKTHGPPTTTMGFERESCLPHNMTSSEEEKLSIVDISGTVPVGVVEKELSA